MSLYPPAAVERSMKLQEAIVRASRGDLSWKRAAQLAGMSARSLRRWRARYEALGSAGLLDRRQGRPSPKRAPAEAVKELLQLYQRKYQGYNVRHFHQVAKREHGVRFSYTFVSQALQEAGLVKRHRKRGPHRKRRERKQCFGEMLHIDGSEHAWLSRVPEKKQSMIVVLDDATSKVMYAQLWPRETSEAVMRALREVVEREGIPAALYSDRAGWAFHTPKAGGKVDKEQLTQVGRALKRLGVEHIPAYSPQARGRSERVNRTLQGRLVNELRSAGVRSVRQANRYLREVFIPAHNEEFARPARDPASFFVSARGTDLEQIFCEEEQRTVGKDNTVVLERVRMQLAKQPGRGSCAGLRVTVRRHLDGRHTIWQGQRLLGRYDSKGNAWQEPTRRAA